MSSREDYYTGANKWPRWLKVLGFVAAVMFCVGMVDLGRWVVSPPRTPTTGGVTVVTTTAPAPPPTVITQTKNVVPAGCKDAIDQMLAMMPSVTAIFNAAQPQLDIMSKARIEIATKDERGLNKVSFEQDALIDRTTDARRDLLERYHELKAKADQCKVSGR